MSGNLISCEAVLEAIPLYFYGELAPPQEDEVEEHLHACPTCAREMERQRALAAALAARQTEPPVAFLEECRSGLMAAIGGASVRQSDSTPGPWRLFLQAMAQSFAGLERLRVPAGAAALVALGFVAARLTMQTPAVDPVFHTVRSIQPDGSGRVQISLDETQRRVVSGRLDDQNIQQLLVAAAHGDNTSARLESVGVMKDHADSSPVRDALLNAVAHDPNAGVRLAALEGLKRLAGEPDVRKTLAQVLLTDEDPAVRIQVVDLLVAHRDDALTGVLQNLVEKDNNNYVRMKSQQALKAINASIGTF
jgi:HEAT repeats/Putative zinc-finger